MNPRGLLAVVALLCVSSCGDHSDPPLDIPTWAKVAPEQIAEAAKHDVPVAFENDLGMRFVLIPAGTFPMGSAEDEEGRDDTETQHEVTLTRPFYMQVTEVTNEQYERFDPKHDSGGTRWEPRYELRMPAVKLKEENVVRFVEWMTDRGCGRSYRLPTEAEWERACRGGTTTRYWWGDSAEEGFRYANAIDTSFTEANWDSAAWKGSDGHVGNAHVGSYPPNPYGLSDMLGNAWELVARDPELHGQMWCVKGGGRESAPAYVRCATRLATEGGVGLDGFGVRLVSPLPEEETE